MSILKWDKEFALEQAADDVELLEELLVIFKGSFSSDLQLIRSGIVSSDADQVTGAAHSMKGAAASLGIEGIAEVAKEIEDDSKAGSLVIATSSLPELDKMLEELNGM